jgi:hypothetical protein
LIKKVFLNNLELFLWLCGWMLYGNKKFQGELGPSKVFLNNVDKKGIP